MWPRPFSRSAAAVAALLVSLLQSDDASAGGDTKITVDSAANIDDGECEGAPNDD